jgi:ubiquinone/menaquinone biosynthesis C-methylase UbiE
LDLSIEMLKLAEASLRPVRGDGRFLPFKEESFDVVLALEILPDVSDLRPFLRELSRVIRTGGQLIVSAINKNSLLHKVFIRFGGGYENFHFHSLQAIYGILQEEALLPVETKFIGFPLPVVWGSHRKTSVLSPLATSWVVQCIKNSTGERSGVAS